MTYFEHLPLNIKHKTLSSYYPHLHRLQDFISPHCDNLLQGSDIDDYTQLLRSTLCGVRESVPWPQRDQEAGCGLDGTQQEAIDRILLEIGRRRDRDVLLSTDRVSERIVSECQECNADLWNHDARLPVNASRPGVENRHANSPSALLRSLAFKILRVRLGDAGFRHLLLHTSLFITVGNNCFLQLSGVPVYDLYQHPDLTSLSTSENVMEIRGKKRKRGDSSDKLKASQNKQPSPATIYISRQSMFYGHPLRKPNGKHVSGLPPKHVLNKLGVSLEKGSNDKMCLILARHVFPSLFCLPSFSASKKSMRLPEDPKIQGSTRRLTRIMGAMREIITRHAKVDYPQILKRCTERKTRDSSQLVEPVPHSRVCHFVSTMIKTLLPSTILGSQQNVETIKRHAHRVIRAKQYEPISLHSLIQGFNTRDLTCLALDPHERCNMQETRKRQSLSNEFIFWIFNDLLIPLLKNCCYITETSATRYETVYYLHDEWAFATRPHFRQLEEDLLEELDPNEKHFALQGPLGVSAVRLIPKPNSGFRPIVNLGRSIKTPFLPGIPLPNTKYTSANQILRSVHQVLTFEKERHSDKLGSSLLGTNEIFFPLQQLKKDLLNIYGKIPKLYFVKMDIRAAFDTIPQDKVLDIVSSLLDKDHDYCLMLYCLLLPPASEQSQGSTRRLFKTKAMVDDLSSSHSFSIQAETIAKPLRNAVIVDLVRRRHVSKESCMSLLRTHIKENIWQIDRRLFRQKTGIPQGSKISSLLCSSFYAAMEREHLQWTSSKPGTKLLRYIDDFLFISDDSNLARRFVVEMNQGFPKYGAFISNNKTITTFDPTTMDEVEPLKLFPYCGFLVDTETLDITMDHPRILSTPAKQSFALRSDRHRGAGFVGWFSRQLENRNHVAYLDTTHNDMVTVFRNVYLNFMLTGMKLPHYFSQEVLTTQQSRLIFDGICAATDYTYAAGRARVRHAARSDRGRDHFAVKRVDFVFLARHAIKAVLGQSGHSSRFREVAKLLSRVMSEALRVITKRQGQ
ncbi:hypothetical protein M231_07866 [Tremella mesenterica]|uniref:Telomerase reverse transcriptase n=1 Tax=Tremella mesenterica TaxID=5217 RepID=A0A4Q1BA70_TREME|nr:hypothetical protein M231_07866 [Tremella mesenterica]